MWDEMGLIPEYRERNLIIRFGKEGVIISKVQRTKVKNRDPNFPKNNYECCTESLHCVLLCIYRFTFYTDDALL